MIHFTFYLGNYQDSEDVNHQHQASPDRGNGTDNGGRGSGGGRVIDDGPSTIDNSSKSNKTQNRVHIH